ncbi:hypothetical protein F2Q70_00011207 [Brassica cretica]|uniref:Uncharacterized protein n=1 Tax=Brassica cretica TaxID=69181 RepID=A0A8S9M108_BRACR|nr:hypothetical protein F2Q70_00011207 [Brassica cretica]
MTVDEQNELPEATQREAELQRQIDDLQGQLTGLHRTRSSVDRCYGMSVDRCYGLSVDRCYGISVDRHCLRQALSI